MDKNTKKAIIIVLVAAIIGSGVWTVVTFKTQNTPKYSQTTTNSTTVSTTVSSAKDTTITTSTTKKDTTTTTKTTAKQDNSDFIYSDYWYGYDNDKLMCYAVKFEKDGTVNIAIFDSKNINGEDSQYFKGYSNYTIKDNQINIEKCENTPIPQIKIDGKNLVMNNQKMDSFDKIKLDYALRHFV